MGINKKKSFLQFDQNCCQTSCEPCEQGAIAFILSILSGQVDWYNDFGVFTPNIGDLALTNSDDCYDYSIQNLDDGTSVIATPKFAPNRVFVGMLSLIDDGISITLVGKMCAAPYGTVFTTPTFDAIYGYLCPEDFYPYTNEECPEPEVECPIPECTPDVAIKLPIRPGDSLSILTNPEIDTSDLKVGICQDCEVVVPDAGTITAGEICEGAVSLADKTTSGITTYSAATKIGCKYKLKFKLRNVTCCISEAQSVIARMNALFTPPDTLHIALYCQLVQSIVECGAWDKCDCIYVIGCHSRIAARMNWKQNAFNLTEYAWGATDFFVPDVGVLSDIPDRPGYDTGYNLLTSGQYAQNDAHLMRFNKGLGISVGALDGNSWTLGFNGGASQQNALNSQVSGAYVNSTSNLFQANDRNNGSTFENYGNGSLFVSAANTSYSPANQNVYLGDYNYYGTPQRGGLPGDTQGLFAFTIGASLTASQHLCLYNAFRNYFIGLNSTFFSSLLP